MKRLLVGYLAFACTVLISASDVRCQERLAEPFELIRSLRSLQDRIARGDGAAFLSYRKALSQFTEQLSRAPEEAWKDPRNVRAAVALVLSGGDPSVLQPLVSQVTGQDLALVRGALAYGQNHNEEAMGQLADVDVRMLDPSVAGHIALVQAELLAKKDREKSLALLAEARLLAPGTMIEEAALRREVALAVESGDADRFETSSRQYVRRFANSAHMPNFRRQWAIDVATRGMAEDPVRRAGLESTLVFLSDSQRLEVYLSIAWEGLKGGGVDLVRWAAAKASQLASEDSAQHLRAKLCEAAVLILTDEFDRGQTTLQGLPVDRLSEEETRLLAAAVRVAKQVRRESKPAEQGSERPRGATEPRVIITAKAAMDRVDDMLSGGRK